MAEFINTVDVIGDEALTNSIIDKSVTEYKDNNIGKVRKYAFRGCSALTNVESPTAVSIDIYAFHSCSALTNADFPVATSIGSNAFQNCSALTSVEFPVATSIGSNAFHSCSALTNADFPVATSIGKNAFYECKTLTSVDFPVATSIGNYAFMYCASLKSVDFPVATSSGSNAFYGCSTLASVDFPVATSIGSSAFNSCYSLTTLILRSETMCTLDNTNAFEYCVHILGTTDSTYNPTGAKDGYIYVPRALVESYKTATNWSTYASQFRAIEDWTVDGTVTGELNIEGRYMVRFFDEDGTLLDYVIVSAGEDAVYPGEDPVKEGEWAFTGFNPSPTNITADMDCYAQFKSTAIFSRKIVARAIGGEYENDRVTTIGSYAFTSCISLSSVTFPAVTTINESAFSGCTNLAKADFASLTTIGGYAFNNCNKLATLILRNATQVATIPALTALTNTPIRNGSGYVYVPASLVDGYKLASVWSNLANQIRAIEDYPEICGGEQ